MAQFVESLKSFTPKSDPEVFYVEFIKTSYEKYSNFESRHFENPQLCINTPKSFKVVQKVEKYQHMMQVCIKIQRKLL